MEKWVLTHLNEFMLFKTIFHIYVLGSQLSILAMMVCILKHMHPSMCLGKEIHHGLLVLGCRDSLMTTFLKHIFFILFLGKDLNICTSPGKLVSKFLDWCHPSRQPTLSQLTMILLTYYVFPFHNLLNVMKFVQHMRRKCIMHSFCFGM